VRHICGTGVPDLWHAPQVLELSPCSWCTDRWWP